MGNKIETSSGYPIFISDISERLSEFLNSGEYSKTIVLVDSHTSEHCLPLLNLSVDRIADCDIIEIDPGETNKNIDICIGILSMMNDFEMDRNSLLINLGGGMVCDMGGFAASVYKRGIDFIHIPTSLLAMADASIGGKTGLDLNSIKNLIGTFADPKAVFIDPDFLITLPERELISGYAEIIKHSLIADADQFNSVKKHKLDIPSPELIRDSVNIKNNIVSQDPYEQGIRKVLNFGHTIGHALESFSLQNDEDHLLHGEAIAIGMICESFLSHKKNGLPDKQLKEICDFLFFNFPSYKIGEEDYDTLIELMKKDKKNKKSAIQFSLLKEIGKCDYDIVCREDDIIEALDFYLQFIK
jgi:3-dehydroquinate synthase